ncbi:hypothetical protein PN836_005730 [Ningiella sp. W23]|uniref:hypothetical protein n=1 Tax=Ningiella sp. W23 TaxID=3023715 RepID=UPI0037584C4C
MLIDFKTRFLPIFSHLVKQGLPNASNDSVNPPLRVPPEAIDEYRDYSVQRDFDFGA